MSIPQQQLLDINNEILQLVKPLEEKGDESSDSDEWVNEDGQAFDIFKDLIDDEE